MTDTAITVRQIEVSDARSIAAYARRNKDFMQQFDPVRPDDFFTDSGQRRRLKQVIPSGLWIGWVATVSDEVVGQAALSNIVRGAFQNATIGYSVDQSWQRRGIATRLVRTVVREAFGGFDLHRVEAGTLIDNFASQRVLEKVGFRRIGLSPLHLHIGGAWRDHIIFALTREHVSPDP